MRTARSSAVIARPASAGRASGSAPATTARRSGLLPRSTQPKSRARTRSRHMKFQALALAFLAATGIGGIAWVFLYPMLSGERKAEQRRSSVAKSEPVVRQAERSQRTRREQVESSLKDLEAKAQKQSKVPLNLRISQAGLDWTVQKFWIISGALGFGLCALA